MTTDHVTDHVTDHDSKTCEATPDKTLREHIMDSRIAKCESEWWAKREIEKLEKELAASKTEVKDLKLELAVSLANQLKATKEVERLREELAKSENEVKSLRKEWRNSFLLEVAMPRWQIKKSDFDGKPYLWDNLRDDNYDLDTLCRILNEYENRLENARIFLKCF